MLACVLQAAKPVALAVLRFERLPVRKQRKKFVVRAVKQLRNTVKIRNTVKNTPEGFVVWLSPLDYTRSFKVIHTHDHVRKYI